MYANEMRVLRSPVIKMDRHFTRLLEELAIEVWPTRRK
jgi:hypothetical protein